MNRREFVKLAAIAAASFALGAIGGITDSHESDDEEPP